MYNRASGTAGEKALSSGTKAQFILRAYVGAPFAPAQGKEASNP
jgi:hypothetical protein